MKKILLLTVAVTLLAGCSKNESEMLKTPANEVRFSNLNDRITRAANDAGNDYRVYAKSTLSSETSWFINDVVDGTLNTAAAGPYYWPAAATVSFFAYAPATSGTVTATYATPSVSIVYTVPSSANEDFTVAEPMTAQSSSTGTPAGTVNFQFEHKLSKVTVNASLSTALSGAGYTISTASATTNFNVASNQGTIDAAVSSSSFASIGGSSATYSGAMSYMIMPQSTTGATLQVKNVTISRGGTTIYTGDLAVFSFSAGNISGNAFVKNTHYALNLEITNLSHDDGGNLIFGDEIKFSATTTTWATSNVPISQP